MNNYKAVVYFSGEEGFSEKNITVFKYENNHHAKINFDFEIPENTQMLRFDPTDEFCIVKSVSLRLSNGEILGLSHHNGINVRGRIYFANMDPNIYFQLSGMNCKRASICATIIIPGQYEYKALFADAVNEVLRIMETYEKIRSLRYHIKTYFKHHMPKFLYRLLTGRELIHDGIDKTPELVDEEMCDEFPDSVGISLYSSKTHRSGHAKTVLTLRQWMTEHSLENLDNCFDVLEKTQRKDSTGYYRQLIYARQILQVATHVDLYFTHLWGGGSEIYMREKIEGAYSHGHAGVVIQYAAASDTYKCELSIEKTKAEFELDEVDDLWLIANRIDKIVLNELTSFPKVEKLLEQIVRIADAQNAEIDFLLHDYHCICPVFCLLNFEGQFCNLPQPEICDLCVKSNMFSNPPYSPKPPDSIVRWRETWQKFFDRCTHATAFSLSSKALFERVYMLPFEMQVIPHAVSRFAYIPPASGYKCDKIIIGVLGIITFLKGREIVSEMAEVASRAKINVRFVIIGSSDREIEWENIIETGPYQREEIPYLVEQHKIDLFLIPSIWPETFSYTTKEAMSLGLPVAAFDLGAQAEHVKQYEKGILIEKVSSLEALNKIMSYFEN